MTSTDDGVGRKRPTRRRRVLTITAITVGALVALAATGAIIARHWFTAEFPRLDAGAAEVGEWYSVSPDGAVNASGDPYHANVRIGSENKVMVMFGGGGVSVDDYTEARPVTGIFSSGFYTVIDGLDQLAKTGLGDSSEANPFKGWTVVQLPYSTGDFHAGAGSNDVTGMDGEPMTVHHTGFTNLELVLDSVREITGSPTELLVTGGSAGGFGAAIATDRIIDFFPETSNVTTMVDSSLLLYDWNAVSKNVWKSPKEISDVLTTKDFTLDALTALKASHPAVKILFASSIRDESLARMQSYLNGGPFAVTREDGVQYEKDLARMVHQLQDQVPDIGLYIFQGKTDDDTGLTQHTIGRDTGKKLAGNTTPFEWIMAAVSGDVTSHGLDRLD